VGQNPVRAQGKYNPFSIVATSVTTACQTGYWNCAAFADPNANRGTGPFQFGDIARNSSDIRSFGFANEDFGINKTFPIREAINAEFRAEFFDAFNRHTFNKPDSGVLDNNFGQVGSTLNGPRNIQFVLKVHY
jgi:hypothetical protein